MATLRRAFVERRVTFDAFETRSAVFSKVLERLRRCAMSDCSVLMIGEPGTGKTMLAQAMHNLSPRREGPLCLRSMGEVRAELLPSDLFGHVKGAYTGADSDRAGLFRSADGGTLFLDEIAALPPDLQVSLLHALEYGEVCPVGSDKYVEVDVRLVLATSLSPSTMREDPSRWRPEFVDRLDHVVVEIPPLRERQEDVAALARRLVCDVCDRDRRPSPTIDPRCISELEARPWWGNLRELAAVLDAALLACDGRVLLPEHLPKARSNGRAHGRQVPTLEEAIRAAAARALECVGGSRRRAAAMLEIGRRRLDRILDGASAADGETEQEDPGSPGDDADWEKPRRIAE